MAGKKSQKIKYVGPSKEELAAQQVDYNRRIDSLMSQNSTLQTQYSDLQRGLQDAGDQRQSLMQTELERQKQAYEAILSRTQQALAESQTNAANQSSLLNDLTGKQEQFSRLQSAQAGKDTQMARDNMTLNRRSMMQSVQGQQVNQRRRRRFKPTVTSQSSI